MNDETYFVETYKQAAYKIKDSIEMYSKDTLPVFPQNDPLKNETLRFVVEGGKRFRPALAYLTAKFYGKDLLEPCLALEYFHKFLLTHDDIVDQDRIRYAVPTVHAKLEDEFVSPKKFLTSEYKLHLKDGTSKSLDQVQFGNSLAIVSGDMMCAEAYRVILDSELSDSKKVQLSRQLSKVTEEVSYGWYIQFLLDYYSFNSSDLSQQKIEESIVWVTGKYTITFPLYFGYCMAGVTVPKGIDELADNLGLLFQTGDDIIGLFGDPEITQKSNYGDIVQGKKTIPIWLTYTLASTTDKKRLELLVGKEDLTSVEAEEVKEIVRNSGGLAKTHEYMHQLKDRCIHQIKNIDAPEDMKRFLNGFAGFLVVRDK
jgi:geranylgeranyl diphosphate synthase, type I